MSLTAKLMLSPVLVAQAIATRARLPRLPEPEGPRQGVAGAASLARAGKPLRLLIAGDSSAAGVGVAKQRDALAHRLATNLATNRCRRPLRVTLKDAADQTPMSRSGLVRSPGRLHVT